MIVRLRIREVAESRGIENAAQLSRRADIAQTTAYALWNGVTVDPGIQTLGAIARALHVQIADLYEDSPEGDTLGNQIAELANAA